MHKLVGPLYGFFQYIRTKNEMPLSIDQYSYFLKAIHHTDTSSIKTKEDLLRFTKIFWLHDPGFESQYNLYFNNFAEWDKLIPKSIPNEGVSASKPVDQNTTRDDGTDNKGPIVNESNQVVQEDKSRDKNELVEFNIILKEGNTQVQNADTTSVALNHSFKLSDSAIMPFDNRNLVQRLRRKVETSELVASDQIDVAEMIKIYTEHGYIDEIVYQMEDTSNSNVVFLADREGSMLAYEFLEQHFINGLKQLPYCNLEHYFFTNQPHHTADELHYILTNAVQGKKDLETHNHTWDKDTWFFIFSDAGAHSGIVNQERIISTLKLWRYLKSISKNVRWLNPVPIDFMNDCTAKRLLMSIPMYDTNEINLIKMLHAKS